MGYIRQHTIVVTGSYGDYIDQAHRKAKEIFERDYRGLPICVVSPIIDSTINGAQSFFVAPDGSKEGWEHSDLGDACRVEFIEWLRYEMRYSDGSSPLDWVEVMYGDDDHRGRIINHDGQHRHRRLQGRLS